MGECTPPSGTIPGIRRPVRTITLPPISSRRIRFGDPTSPVSLGRHGGGLEPETVVADRARRLVDDCVAGGAAVLERQVEAGERDVEADHGSIEKAQRGLQELLAGLVTLENDDRVGIHCGRL